MADEKKVRIRITRSGIYGANGDIPVGSEFNVKESDIPANWAGRYDIIKKSVDDSEPHVNPTSPSLKDQVAGLKDNPKVDPVVVDGNTTMADQARVDAKTTDDSAKKEAAVAKDAEKAAEKK